MTDSIQYFRLLFLPQLIPNNFKKFDAYATIYEESKLFVAEKESVWTLSFIQIYGFNETLFATDVFKILQIILVTY